MAVVQIKGPFLNPHHGHGHHPNLGTVAHIVNVEIHGFSPCFLYTRIYAFGRFKTRTELTVTERPVVWYMVLVQVFGKI